MESFLQKAGRRAVSLWRTPWFISLLCVLILLLGFAFRLSYVEITPYNVSKHDLGYGTGMDSERVGAGHLGYIEYIAKNGHLPDFDPTTKWSFYNPPFFHITAAGTLALFSAAGLEDDAAWEGVQYLPCLAIFAATVGIWFVLRAIGAERAPMLIGVTLAAFHPSLSYLSLALNNDAFSISFTVWAIYFAFKWYEAPRWYYILPTAAAIGLGMMTKLSVALVAPSVALFFLWRFFRDKRYLPMLGEFGLFVLVCVPLGLYWSVRNGILYHIAPTYVQSLPENSAQSVTNFSLWERFGLPTFSDFLRVESSWSPNSSVGFADHNIWSQTLRTSLFDDNALTFAESGDETAAKILMVASLALFLLFLAVGVIGLGKHFKRDRIRTIGIAAFVLFLLLNFVKFCFDFPFTCTIHFRYITPLLLWGGVGLSLFWGDSKKKLPARVTVGACAVLTAFCSVCATVLYLRCL